MNQINKNRLIGGGVLVFASLLFAPTILTPKNNELINPNLAINIQKTPESETVNKQPVQVAGDTTSAQPPVKLVSIDNKTMPGAPPERKPMANQSDKQKTQPVSMTRLASPNKKNTQLGKNSSWLRVGSFSSKKNANSLLKELEKKYPIKVETINVDRKTYHRVLVGPYSDEASLQKAKVALKKNGYDAGIQR